MNLALILFLGGVVVVAWIYFWARQQMKYQAAIDLDQVMRDVPSASHGDALIVSQEHGKLLYANEPARRLIGMNGGSPHLEQFAKVAEPADNFLQLFVQEGQSSFQIGERWVQATSHQIPTGIETRTVVVMRQLTSEVSSPDMLDINVAMSLINEIGETVNASMGIAQVLPAILTIIRRVIESDAGEITLWDPDEKVLIQRGWDGDSMYLIALSEYQGRYAPGEGISGWIANHQKPVLLNTQDDLSGIQPKLVDSNPYNSFVAVPLKLGDRFIGTLELASEKVEAYTRGDLALLQAVSKTVAGIIFNTDIYAQQAQRVDDLANLQRMIQVNRGDGNDTSSVYAALNERIAHLLSADMCGILLYDADRKGLVAAPPFHGLPEALVRTLFIPLPAGSPQHDIWTKQSVWISNDVQDEPLVEALGLTPLVSVSGISNSAWVPLSVSDQRIGVLAVSNKRTEGGFGARDIQNLTVLASQATIVIENLRLYDRERRMDTELVGLQELTNAIGALSHEAEFFGEITERIARLMEIEMCGILLYDDDRKQLVSQAPFFGVDDALIEDYAIDVKPGSVVDQLWDDERYLYINRVASDTLVFEVGLNDLAEKIGVQKTMFAVLYASGRKLGLVQVSNKVNGQDFTDEDARLLMIFATQTAATIENARLYREAQRSADQAQGLRRVAELAGNVLTSEDNFSPILTEISHLTNSELVFVNVLNSQTGSLVTFPRYVHGMELSEPIVQDIYADDFEASPVSSGQAYVGNDVRNDPRTIAGYRQIATRMNIDNAILVPLIFGDRTLGELGIANRPDGPYLPEDLDMVKVIASQTAAALDRLLIYEATGQNLSRRLDELDAISRVSNELTITLDLKQVIEVIREEAVKATNAAGSTVIMLRDPQDWKFPDVPEMDSRLGNEHDMPRIADIELEAIARGADTVLITDYEFSTMEPLPVSARSAVAAAILYLDQVVGVIHLYHNEANHFDDRGAAFLMTLAVKASLGYGNSTRFQDQLDRSDRLRRRAEQLNRIFELGHMFQSNTDPASILEAIAYSVQQSVGFDVVVMTLFDDETDTLKRVAQAGLPITLFQETTSYTMPRESLKNLFTDEYRLSESYFFPIEEVGQWYVEHITALSTSYEGNRSINSRGRNTWRDGDMLLVPLQGASGRVLGVMSLDRPFDNKRPEQSSVEILEIFAHQAATTIENTRLYLDSVRNAEQEARLNELLEAVSSTLDVGDIIRSVAEGALRLLPFSRMTAAIIDSERTGFEMIRVLVQPDNTLELTRDRRASLGNSAMQRAFEDVSDQIYHLGDEETEVYDDLRTWYQNGEMTSLILPLQTGGENLGAIHIGSDLDSAYGFREFRPLLRRMAQMVASAVQNARLFDQAVGLQILNQSVVESIEQGIVVLDNSGRIISVNNFMVDRYGWDLSVIGSDLFAYRPLLSDILSDHLRSVLETGEQQERINQLVKSPSDEDIISNFYLYPLRFEDSIRGAVMLVEDVTERARLQQEMESRANQLAALTDVSTRITSSLERADVVKLALEEMGWLMPYDAMTLWRRNGSYMVLEGATGQLESTEQDDDVRFLFSEYEMMRQVVETQKVVSVGARVNMTGDIPLHTDVGSWMGVPLVNQGHVVGMMMLTTENENSYVGVSDQNIAMAFASQVAIAEANAELFEQTFDRTNELGTLLEAAQATSLTTDLDSVFQTVVELMFSALDMDDCAIMIWDDVDNEIEVQVDMNRDGDSSRVISVGTRFDLGEYPAKQRSLREREVIVIMASDDETPYTEEITELRKQGDGARMLVPLVVRERSIGLIQLEQSGSEIVTQQKVRMAQGLGTQVAVAIENARLSAETAAHFEESMIINELSHAISSTLELDDMIEVVRDQVPRVTNSRELYVALYDPDESMITFPVAVKDGETYEIPPRPLGTDEVSFIIKHRRPLSLGADYFSPDELRKSLGITNGEGDAKSYLGVPLMAGDEVYGVLAVRDTVRKRAFTVNEQRILNIVGPQLGAAIQNARLFKQVSTFADDLNQQVAERTRELEEERDRIDILYQITSELARTLDMERLMPRALGMVATAVNAADGVIMQLDPITDQLYSRAVLNPASLQANPDGEHDIHPSESIARWLIEEDEHVEIISDLLDTDYWDPDAPGAAGWRSALAVLLETNEELLGVMVLLSKAPNAFVESHLHMLVAAANQVASSINNAELYKLIRDQAERLGSLLRAEQEEAEKNKAILEGIADGVVLADAEGNIILFNTAAERILQLPRERAMGQSLNQLTGIYSGSSGSWAEIMETQMGEFITNAGGDYIDERIELNGRIVSVHLSPVYTGDKFLGTVSVFRDVTREVEADRSKSDFITNVSHEFRTPLTPIKGYIDMVLMGATGQVTDGQKQVLGTVKRNVDRLAALVDDVLKISALDKGDNELTLVDVNINELIDMALKNLNNQTRHKDKGHDVIFDPDVDVPSVRADADKVLQIVSNIIDNAYNYTPAGGTVTIVANVNNDDRTVVISVADTGVGIPEEFSNNVWERFKRHDDTALGMEVAGTGLGMPIVKELVEMHGGRVWFESELNVGTTFYVELPINRAETMASIPASDDRSN